MKGRMEEGEKGNGGCNRQREEKKGREKKDEYWEKGRWEEKRRKRRKEGITERCMAGGRK